MEPVTADAVIVIRRPRHFFGGARSFLVWIDGRRVGKVRPHGVAEFPVGAGDHTVVVSMDWLRSSPARVAAVLGSRVELAIGGRSRAILKMVVPVIVAAIAAPLGVEWLRAIGGPVDAEWWVRWVVFFAVYIVVFGGYTLLASALVRDYWAVWTLEPADTGSSSAQAGAEPLPLPTDLNQNENP